MKSKEDTNKALVLKAMDTLFNKRDFAAAQKFWSPTYLQHSAFVPAGREGLFGAAKKLPPGFTWTPGMITADGDLVMIHSRYSGTGLPTPWIVVDILKIKNGVFVEHWDVIQNEVTKEQSKGGHPMFGKSFLTQHPDKRDAKPKAASELLKNYLAFSMRDAKKTAAMFSENGAFEMPYLADFGWPAQFLGREKLAGFFKKVRELYPGFQFENLVIHMQTPEQVFAEYEFTAVSSVTKRKVTQHLFGWLVAENGKIKLLREALNAAVLAQALYERGIPDLPIDKQAGVKK
jgi:predicted SnoaL-like aldol condensation-catalyzing enzyme